MTRPKRRAVSDLLDALGPPIRQTIATLLSECAELRAENELLRSVLNGTAAGWRMTQMEMLDLRAERDHLARMLNPPPQR